MSYAAMKDQSPDLEPSPLDKWLAGLGFNQGNPFATVEANQERSLLPDFFVEVDSYDQIKGDQTVIVFAPRGGGKSALRVVLAGDAAPLSLASTTLAVECTDFDILVQKLRRNALTIDDYVPWLLHTGAKTLLDAFCDDPESSTIVKRTATDEKLRISRAASLAAPDRSRLAHLLRTYHPSLLSPEMLYKRLKSLDASFSPASWKKFVQFVAERRLNELVAKGPLQGSAIAALLTDLNDYPLIDLPLAYSATGYIGTFLDLARASGFASVHFLIDCLDERMETANNPEAQADILEPLLAHLPVLEMPGAAFKFFLSKEMRNALLERPTIRRDRLIDQAVMITWNHERLKALLDTRLNTYSNGQVQELSQICREIKVKGAGIQLFWLGEWIEAEMLRLAQNSPRTLLMAGQLLFQVHLDQYGPSGLLEKDDWEAAKVELLDKEQPTLIIFRDRPLFRISGREVKLSKQEHKILLTLARENGRCDRETLAEEIWSSREGVSNYAIDKVINRIRHKLHDEAQNPIYLVTEKGRGYKLNYYELD